MYALLCTQDWISYYQEIFHQILLCLTVSKINYLESDSWSLNQHPLLSLVELIYLLASYRSSLHIGLCVHERVCKCVCILVHRFALVKARLNPSCWSSGTSHLGFPVRIFYCSLGLTKYARLAGKPQEFWDAKGTAWYLLLMWALGPPEHEESILPV